MLDHAIELRLLATLLRGREGERAALEAVASLIPPAVLAVGLTGALLMHSGSDKGDVNRGPVSASPDEG